ncbi:hypothetical protein ES288_A07G174700v1 [Gossypium darwinii]|uniref:Uncharacterized protein n=1 Tax=Gossypium darwinii TaxID=34276 RepID=A0A5D2FZ37_GOSDA|nr:hypothetical protein ES288_A07G174700v1 [Gossypium darwinii]
MKREKRSEGVKIRGSLPFWCKGGYLGWWVRQPSTWVAAWRRGTRCWHRNPRVSFFLINLG